MAHLQRNSPDCGCGLVIVENATGRVIGYTYLAARAREDRRTLRPRGDGPRRRRAEREDDLSPGSRVSG